MRKLTREDHIVRATQCGVDFVAVSETDSKGPATWRCRRPVPQALAQDHNVVENGIRLCGAEFPRPYPKLKPGAACRPCTSRRSADLQRLTDVDYHAAAAGRGVTWREATVPRTTGTPTIFECPSCHEDWRVTYSNFVAGGTCDPCMRGRRRLGEADYEERGRLTGARWLGPLVSANDILTYWECPDCNQPFPRAYDRMRPGARCASCAPRRRGRNRRHTEAAHHRVARIAGIEFVGPVKGSALARTWWKCACGKPWKTSYNRVEQNPDARCQQCGIKRSAKTRSNGAGKWRRLARRHRFRRLEAVPPNSRTRIKVECRRCLHRYGLSYNQADKPTYTGCTACGMYEFRNGKRWSLLNERVLAMTGGEPNQDVRVGRRVRYPDITFVRDGRMIRVEIDTYYAHGGREDVDHARNQAYIDAGLPLIVVRTINALPTMNAIETRSTLSWAGTPLRSSTSSFGITASRRYGRVARFGEPGRKAGRSR